MLRTIKILAFLLLLASTNAFSQQFITISGMVLEEYTNNPVPFHPVYVSADDSLFLNTYITDESGFFRDSIFTGGTTFNYLNFMTFDCIGLPHDTTVYNLSQMIFVEFRICADSIPTGCQADFLAFPQGPDPYAISFVDVSFGPHDQWFWDFGDSTFSQEQNPTHLYNSTGEFLVCLTISSINGLCNSTICYPVIVSVQECDAYFEFISNPANPLEISFLNRSTGNFSEVLWDFGDGAVSQDDDPTHLYQLPGEYLVCLTITGGDSLDFCYDMYCLEITAGTGIPCTADFSYRLDSLSLQSNVYQFMDLSTGNIDSWYWDFGDGSISFDQNPTHQYADSGQYTVCLTVSNSVNPNQCNDTYCLEFSTPAYYNFGGLVWAGNYPLNNPVFSSDTGMASLYRLSESQLYFIQNKRFHENGYYWFANVLEGEYLLKVGLTPGSTSYSSYLPTYFGDQVSWDAAGIISLHGDLFDKQIRLVPAVEIASGPGKITGYISYEGYDPAGSGDQTTITLSDENNHPLDFTEPDHYGSFEFTGLPYATYMVRADLAGHPSEPQLITLSPNSPLASFVELIINESAFFEVNENQAKTITGIKVYPNPARDWLNIDLDMANSGAGSMMISGITGNTLLTWDLHFTQGKQTLRIDTSQLPGGIYVIRISTSHKLAPVIIKFIK